MTAIKKEELERLEEQYGLSPDGLTYQHRCSRITAYMTGHGEEWEPPAKKQKASLDKQSQSTRLSKSHPL